MVSAREILEFSCRVSGDGPHPGWANSTTATAITDPIVQGCFECARTERQKQIFRIFRSFANGFLGLVSAPLKGIEPVFLAKKQHRAQIAMAVMQQNKRQPLVVLYFRPIDVRSGASRRTHLQCDSDSVAV